VLLYIPAQVAYSFIGQPENSKNPILNKYLPFSDISILGRQKNARYSREIWFNHVFLTLCRLFLVKNSPIF